MLRDPLEQFDVVLINGIDIINFLLSNLCFNWVIINSVIFIILKSFATTPISRLNTYQIVFLNCFLLIKSLLKSNLYVRRQIFILYIYYIFLFILLSNIFGMLPYSYTITSQFVITFFISLTSFIAINVIGFRLHGVHYFSVFVPHGVPFFILPLLTIIEMISYFARVFSLAIRLFANMMAGHTLLKILMSFSWSMICSNSILATFSIFPIIIVFLVCFLEIAIAFLQAYVFVTLLIIYLNEAINLH